MRQVTVEAGQLRIGESLALSFQRTLRVPEDGRTYPLPPSLGRFPVHPVGPFRDRLPATWDRTNAFLLPMYQSEALWLALDAPAWRPAAVKIGVGGVNAVSGQGWKEELSSGSQDYVVCPPQRWVDGVNAGDRSVRQFVCRPLGVGSTVEAQVSGSDEVGGIQLLVYRAKPGRFPDEPPEGEGDDAELPFGGGEMGVAAGGSIGQKIYADPHGVDTWDQSRPIDVFVHLLDSERYLEITGLSPPPTPADATAYTEAGLPWFELYDEGDAHVAPPDRLRALGGSGAADTGSVDIPTEQVHPLRGATEAGGAVPYSSRGRPTRGSGA